METGASVLTWSLMFKCAPPMVTLPPRVRVALSPSLWLGLAIGVYCVFVAREAFWLARGPQDNDWPLLMWLARAGMDGNLSALAVGHYGFLQLVLVRLLGPLCGGTLFAAKALNVVGVGVCCIVLDRALAALGSQPAWRGAGLAVFALSYPTFVTGWAEFGDPLALAFFASGVAVLLARHTKRSLLVAGALVGAAGLVRLHFQTMGWGTILAFAGLELSRQSRRVALERVALFACAVIIAQLPVFLLNLKVHGTLFSPIAKSFMGQVLFGANEFDMANSYAAAPFDGLMSEHGLMLLSVIRDRLLDVPLLMATLLGFATVALLKRDQSQPVRAFTVLLAFGYYVGFVAPSWGITPRLLMGFVFLVALAVGLMGHAVMAMTTPRIAMALGLTVLAVSALHFRGERRAFRAQRNHTRMLWDRNARITAVVRAHGVTSPTQVFASDWFVYATDDPEMISFYNWGFWNLLVQEFAIERPNPYAAIGDPSAFESFLVEHGVRIMVLNDEPRLPAVSAIVHGAHELRAFGLLEKVDDQYIYGLLD